MKIIINNKETKILGYNQGLYKILEILDGGRTDVHPEKEDENEFSSKEGGKELCFYFILCYMQKIPKRIIIRREQGEPFNFHIVSVKDKTHIQLCHELVSWLFYVQIL